jgi:transposase
MANHLTMAKVNGILELHRAGWSQRRIAKALDIDRKSVAAYLGKEAAKGATAPTGSASSAVHTADEDHVAAGEQQGTPATLSPQQDGPQQEASASLADAARELATRSLCGPWEEIIQQKLDLGLSAQRIYQDLVSDHGFEGKYPSVRRYVARLKAATPLPFRRMEHEPGAEAQVDFGTGAPLVLASGRRRKTYVFRIVLSHSRKAYSEVVERQTTENFIRALENAFTAFHGVPRTLVIDNLRAAVKRVDWFEPELNPKVRCFCEHYGVTILPTRPYMPSHKGKVERGIDYVKENALKGRTFESVSAQNRHLEQWEEQVADNRIHGTTKKQVGALFRDHDRPALQPLAKVRFPCFEEGARSVHRDGHVEVAKAYYSVPPEYLTREVWVRWDARTVRIFNQRFEQICLHARQQPGQFSTHAEHIAAEKITGVERGAAWLLQKAQLIGPAAMRWATAMLAERGVEGVRVLQGLLSLTKKHRSAELEQVCESAWRHQAYQLRTIRKLLEQRTAEQQTLEFLDEHPLIRSMSEYGQFVHETIQGGIH